MMRAVLKRTASGLDEATACGDVFVGVQQDAKRANTGSSRPLAPAQAPRQMSSVADVTHALCGTSTCCAGDSEDPDQKGTLGFLSLPSCAP